MLKPVTNEQVAVAAGLVTHVGVLSIWQNDSGRQHQVQLNELQHYFYEDGTEAFYTSFADDKRFAALHFFNPPRVWGNGMKSEYIIRQLDSFARQSLICRIEDEYFRI